MKIYSLEKWRKTIFQKFLSKVGSPEINSLKLVKLTGLDDCVSGERSIWYYDS